MSTLLLVLACVTLFVGDSITAASPGYVDYAGGGRRAITYHLSDSILFLDDLTVHYGRIVLALGTHAVHGSDRLLAADDEILFRRRYGQLLDAAGPRANTVIAINIPWLGWGPAKADLVRRYNAIIASEATRRGVAVVDAWAIMEECGPACIGPDGFHPNATGHLLIARALLLLKQAHTPGRDQRLPVLYAR